MQRSANSIGTMETRDHSKNGASLKSLTSKKNFTRLICVFAGLALACLPTLGQHRVEAQTIEPMTPKQGVELRRNENKLPKIKPDSIITYSASGEKVSKKEIYFYYNITYDYYEYVLYKWNNKWIYQDSLHFIPDEFYYFIQNDMLYVHYLKMGADDYIGWGVFGEALNLIHNEDGQLSRYETWYSSDKNKMWFWGDFVYNEDGQVISIIQCNEIMVSEHKKARQFDYKYNANGNMIYYELYTFTMGGDKSCREKSIAMYDSEGRKVTEVRYVGDEDYEQYLLNEYDIYYYSESHTPNVETGNNTSVGNDNKGGFDITINIPVDSIAGGSFVIQLPDGFTLDKSNTKLTVDFGSFDLVITQQENNSWLLELKPKATRSATLQSVETGTPLLHVAYTVNPAEKRGTYDIKVHSIQFNTPGNDLIPEPAITVPATLNRWGVGNEAVVSQKTEIRISDGMLYIRSDRPEQVAVYSVTGAKLYESAIPSGLTTIDADRFPKGVLIVVTGKYRQKIINN
jgi:hypothetical protein